MHTLNQNISYYSMQAFPFVFVTALQPSVTYPPTSGTPKPSGIPTPQGNFMNINFIGAIPFRLQPILIKFTLLLFTIQLFQLTRL